MNKKITQYNYQLKKEKQKKFFFTILFCLILFVIINLILTFLVYPVKQKSSSMNPDVPEQSCIMISPLVTNYDRGDVVLINSRLKPQLNKAGNLLNILVSFFTGQQFSIVEDAKSSGTKQHLRRIIGMPGDTIYMRDYVMYIKPAGEKHFLTEFEITPKVYNVTFFAAPSGWDSSIGVKGSFEEITLNDDEYFVLGDNRKSTDDSRLWGVVTSDNISGKALFCYFPLNKFKLY